MAQPVEGLNQKYKAKAKELIEQFGSESDSEMKTLAFAYGLACAGFEGALAVYEENIEVIREMLRKYPPREPREPPDCGTSSPTRRCWWCRR